ncbi:pyridoxamine 5'-phosphate oxidase family protein [Microbacterium sp. LMI12-1-1.1]|uniref:pyridoxine/pyridoxamine 5'-phosphate oxidase n=1 Tax=unclassified Microbacterium TaxID=2609290 RepID=UPI0034398896
MEPRVTNDLRARLRAIPSLTGSAPGLDTAALRADPAAQFVDWLDDAVLADVPEPLAMTLSTIGADGMPDARTLILKDVDARGWAFAGRGSSRSGAQLAANPVAALTFWWQPMVRAVRVRGRVVRATRAESEADLLSRSAAARAGVPSEDWTLWRLQPTRVEFWQGSTDRRHTRIVYHLNGDGWSMDIAPGGDSSEHSS